MAGALRDSVRYGRGEQQLLPAARKAHVRGREGARAAWFSVRPQSEPVPHAHEETEGSEGAARAVPLTRACARAQVRSDPLSTAAAVAAHRRRHRTLRSLFESAEPPPAARD